MRMKINVLGISNVQWTGPGQHTPKNSKMFYAWNNDPAHRYEVEMLLG